MIRRHRKYRHQVKMDFLLTPLKELFQQIPDSRACNKVFKLSEILLSAFAMFVLKYPSLLSFEKQTHVEKSNLKNLFNIDRVCSDAQMRRVLDKITPQQIDQLFIPQFEHLQKAGLTREYLFLNKYLIVSIDGVEFFRSKKIHCTNCQKTKHSNGEVSYNHSMLCAVIVHPDRKEVFPIANEAIQKQDGKIKNDCELIASKRLQAKLNRHFGEQPFLVVEDAMFANEPHINQILANNWNYLISVKPRSQTVLFDDFDRLKGEGKFRQYAIRVGNKVHRFQCADKVLFNHNGMRTNMIFYQEISPNGKVQTYSWITSLKPTMHNVYNIMLAARSRWKIENETFNTLKNQGYHFEHNYGHGNQFLCHVLSTLMLLAFLFDQLIQACNTTFQKVWKAARTKVNLWERQRAVFITMPIENFDELWSKLALIFEVQLE